MLCIASNLRNSVLLISLLTTIVHSFVRNCYFRELRNNRYALNLKHKIRSAEWAREKGLEPGFGGYWPGDPNAKKHKVTIRNRQTKEEYVQYVPEDRYIYFAFEEEGVELPIHNKPRMCRQGCCTICAMKVIEGKVKMDAPLGLLRDLRNEGYALSCCAYPRSDVVCELQDEDEMYIKQWSEGFEGGGVVWGGVLPEDD